jgi:RNA polymerase sigma factor (sigma-70 family)
VTNHASVTRAPIPASPADDAAIVERSFSHPEEFAALFDRHYSAIHGYLARRVGAGRADDLASETFLVAFDSRRRFDLSHRSARPWLYGIASNLVARHRRAEMRHYRAIARAGTPTDAVDGHALRVAAEVDAAAQRPRLAAALTRMAERDREVLLLVAWGGLSCEEAAEALGIPSGTARSRLHRARRQMRDTLGHHDPTNPAEDHR